MNNSLLRTQAPMMGGSALSTGRGAALLIDFDNVTMNVRSDLGKELKSLLDSEMFRGKIAVRRAYADWRRYPASVVPLTEASVDLIFAPAYGTSKKNATDLRMAVDAIELAFMRPEIGVFILLTGDSDFSSCVMKLKEYGKYVIGVGMRESASDLLIQNCDEYYSYHNLSGLTRATEDTGVRENPWELARKAAETMTRRGDVMRVDRLKQVMVELDPGFSEKDIGYSKFSKFISEAQQRGALRVRKTDSGDWEVLPVDSASDGPESAEAGEARVERDRESRDNARRGRGRGRFGDRYRDRDGRDRDRDRDRGDRDRGDRERPRYDAPSPIEVEVELEQPAAAAEAPARTEAPQRERTEAPARAEVPPFVPSFAEPDVEAPPAEAPAAAAAPAGAVDPLRNAYALLQHTVRQMAKRPGDTVRDGDVKRRMLEAQPDWDEHAFGFSKFGRFLRAAHDAEVVDVRRLEDGGYEVLLPTGGKRLPAPVLGAAAGAAAPAAPAESAAPASGETAAAAPRGARGGRGRGRRGEPSGPPPLLPGQVVGDAAPAAAEAPRREEPARPAEEPREPEMTPAQALQERQDGDAIVTHREPAVATARIDDPASIANRGSSTSSGAIGLRRGGRGGRRGGEPSGPPPLLPGQVISVGGVRAPEPAPQPEPEPQPVAAEAPQAEAPAREERGGRRGRGRGREEAPRAEAAPEEAAAPAEAAAAPFDAARLGLPSDRSGIVERIATYNFVGRATGEALVDAYGPEVWRTLDENPDAVRELLGARKARPLLEQWGAERDQLIANAPAPAPAEPEPLPVEATVGDTEAAAEPVAEEPAGRSRGRRGGRGRGRTSPDDSAPAQAEAVVGDTDPTLMGAAGAGLVPGGYDEPSPAAQAEEVVGDTDPTLMGDLSDDAPRGRSRGRRSRGGRGRGRGGDAGEATAEAAAPVEAPAPAPEPAPAEEARPAGRGGRGRGRGGRGAAEAVEAAAPAPAPAPEPAPAEAPAGGRRGRGRGRGGAAVEAAAPAPEAAPAVTTEPAGGRGRSRRGGRGAGAAAAEAPAPAPTPPAAPPAEGAEGGGGGGRPRRRGGRGRRGGGRGGAAE